MGANGFDNDERVSYGHTRIRSRSLLTVPLGNLNSLPVPLPVVEGLGDAPADDRNSPVVGGTSLPPDGWFTASSASATLAPRSALLFIL